MPVQPGQMLSHYRLVEKIGEGGMGVVWKAVDTTLEREVAIKTLPAQTAADSHALARFRREARALAALDHPNIVTVHSVEQSGDLHFLTMALVEGETLNRRIPDGGMALDELLDVALPMTDALAAAHERGVVHRDLKPANVMIATDGRLRVLDFGLAKTAAPGAGGADGETATTPFTQPEVAMGTVPYMSPEQIQAHPADSRSDVFSLGVVLYEMITGRRPFSGDSAPQLIASILKDEPDFAAETQHELPRELLTLVKRCLEKDPARRPGNGGEVRDALLTLRRGTAETPWISRRWPVLLGAAALVAVLLGAGWMLFQRNRALAMQAEALPQLAQLSIERKYVEAFELARTVERVVGPDAVPDDVWDEITRTVSVTTEPRGARITLQPYGIDHDPWVLGEAPLTDVRVPRGVMHWRVEHEGYASSDLVSYYPPEPFILIPENDRDADMVRVPGAEVQLWSVAGLKAGVGVPIGPFLIDRHEVSNRDYAAFVTAGGYRREEYWKHPFHDGEATLSFPEAMERFRDATGRPGPAGWRLGSYPDRAAGLPVTGVSWYEAAAYAEFAGKELPTLYHWYQADTGGDNLALPGIFLPQSNFESAGPRAAGASCVLGAHGAHNMAGNVREWSATATGPDRITLGGAWSDPSYIYLIPEARPPFDRGAENGFRCIRRLEQGELSPLALAPIEKTGWRDFSLERPVKDELYTTFERFFDKERVALEPRIESTDDSAERWIKQKVSYAAGYGDERLVAWLYLPRNATPPYQAIIQMGGVESFFPGSSEAEGSIFGTHSENILRGGRAILLPLWKGSYERWDGFHPLDSSAAVFREHAIQWVSELRRSVDYLQSRDDIDPERIGYQGISYGAVWGPMFLALEKRLRVGLLICGGFNTHVGRYLLPPEIDVLNYAPRVTAPVLMLNGRHDPLFPYVTSQLPMFLALGPSEEDKRHVTFPGGHYSSGWMDHLIRESLDWLDRHLGEPLPAT